jgi:DNA-binding MarR family transcriptional regulator/FixJ family two-component response regulator
LALHILIVSADEQTAALCAEAAKSLGHACHIARTEDEARGLFAQHSQINFVIHNATTSAQHGLDLLSSLNDRTQNGRNFIAILLANEPDFDLAVTAMRQGVSDLLTLPLSPDAIISALERASAQIMSKQDATAQPDLTDSISLIQSSLSALMNKLGVQEPILAKMELDVEATLSAENSIDPAMLKAIIKAIIKARRNRHKFFEGDLFSDPSWDILLELTAAHLNGRQESVTSLAIAASVPASTAIRKIRELADRNLIHRWTDPNDARRIFVALTEDAAKRMMAMLASAQKAAII